MKLSYYTEKRTGHLRRRNSRPIKPIFNVDFLYSERFVALHQFIVVLTTKNTHTKKNSANYDHAETLFFQERGVGAFPPNFVVTTMMDVAAVRAHDKNPIMCSSCEDKLPAAARCIECMDFLCHDCRNAHMRLRLTKTHRVSALSLLP